MPITPRFKLSQDDTHLIITIQIPHIRVSASTLEIIVDKNEFHFYSSPYLLHLTFPAALLDDAEIGKEAKATYDPSNQNGTLTVKIFKEEEGLWKDLDLLGKLMNRKELFDTTTSTGNGRENKSKIQVLDSTETVTEQQLNQNEDRFFHDTDISDEPLNDLTSIAKPHYGFLQMHHSVFTDYAREGLAHEMLEIPNPDDVRIELRREMRIEMENQKFNADRYLGDLYLSDNYDDDDDDDDEAVDMTFIEAIRFSPHWNQTSSSPSSLLKESGGVDKITSQMQSLKVKAQDTGLISVKCDDDPNQNYFTEDESLRLASIKATLPPLIKISKEQTKSMLLSLLDILYAYTYDHRITCADPTCESSWTIVLLSPTLAWLETYTTPYDSIIQVFQWCIRRALIYPYLRNFDMVSKLLIQDVTSILGKGRRTIIRCLLQIQKILEESDRHYLFNKLYINSYICWLQMMDENDIECFAMDVKNSTLVEGAFNKENIGLELQMIEQQALNEGIIEESLDLSNDDEVSQSSSDEDSSSDDDDSTSSDESPEEIGTKKVLITEL